jgi:DNA-binding transcriptional regulator YhcF (GntR family)
MAKSRTSVAELLLELDGSGPLTGRLERALRAAVREGRLPADTVLPSTRALAQELGVSRGVVGAAYAQLGAEGYLAVRQGAAVRVAEVERARTARPEAGPEPPARYNLRPDLADYASFPRREWLASLRTVLTRAADEAFGYGDARGALELRTSLAAYLGRTRGVVTERSGRSSPSASRTASGPRAACWSRARSATHRGRGSGSPGRSADRRGVGARARAGARRRRRRGRRGARGRPTPTRCS